MPRRPFHQLEHLLLTFAAAWSAAARAAATSARFRPAPGARRAPRHSMPRSSMRWVDRLPINRPVSVGKPGHVVCAIAHPRVIREAEGGRCSADGATVNAFARSLRLGITDLVSHRDLSLDDTRHGCVRWAQLQMVCTLDKISRSRHIRGVALPRVQPIIPTWRKEPFDDPEWLFEFKYDGFRGLCYLEPGRCRFISPQRQYA